MSWLRAFALPSSLILVYFLTLFLTPLLPQPSLQSKSSSHLAWEELPAFRLHTFELLDLRTCKALSLPPILQVPLPQEVSTAGGAWEGLMRMRPPGLGHNVCVGTRKCPLISLGSNFLIN